MARLLPGGAHTFTSGGDQEESLVAAFPDHERRAGPVRALERAGIPPDVSVSSPGTCARRVRPLDPSVRRARSRARCSVLIAVTFVLAGGETMRQNVVAILLDTPALIIGFAG